MTHQNPFQLWDFDSGLIYEWVSVPNKESGWVEPLVTCLQSARHRQQSWPYPDNKDHSLFHSGFNCQWNLPPTQCQPDVCAQTSICEVQTRKLEMVSCSLEVRIRGLNQDFSCLFLALSLTHHVTLDQSMELSTSLPQEENRTGEITDYFCSFCFQQVPIHSRWKSLFDHKIDF